MSGSFHFNKTSEMLARHPNRLYRAVAYRYGEEVVSRIHEVFRGSNGVLADVEESALKKVIRTGQLTKNDPAAAEEILGELEGKTAYRCLGPIKFQ
ncbi:hypothetical protein A3A67_04680 [Candidatus Peribacteria bacterium RIFCSPLOWO2_01_FULL_51_18]|nr:MAG: hypothetical protein A3C52_01895 [Candidatus Peribacteria bacterium RIFCSPHIGHO2_02_FULL_51_15]OGJ66702.1 MAG: hypothetical protein A3A67_04680 [Candidatus Peribacteria bacterium RIFCSPLOWO2_01_FULL_51_18]OGJ68367.1 MAG: hypothetical protein A3J34_04820 [Candidatus Peribacteria bacterium RIFCSPLOWO2_02_FULL_51_10]